MGKIDLVNYEKKAREAVQAFWGNREKAAKKSAELGKKDTGKRGSVTAGNNMDGFISLVVDIVKANGLADAKIYIKPKELTIPGFFRPKKRWDVLVINNEMLVAAIELKSHVGSFSNNFNNRVEEALGTAHDFWTAFEKDTFGKDSPRPFVGWLMLVEDTARSNKKPSDKSSHFLVFPEFKGTSYLDRYRILCERMVKQKLYAAASVIKSSETAKDDGAYTDFQGPTSLLNFVSELAGHIAIEAARSRGAARLSKATKPGDAEKRVPLYDLKAAAGGFSELQRVADADKQWVNVPDDVRVSADLFACKVVGESMNKTIPNGSICLFREYSAGPRENLIVLVQHASIEDEDMGAGYTVKEYHSTKIYNNDGTWKHDTITLKPRSNDAQYKDKIIELSPDEKDSLKVIGVFVRVLF
jgi:hypothetical protein